jgi:hypothetical protein
MCLRYSYLLKYDTAFQLSNSDPDSPAVRTSIEVPKLELTINIKFVSSQEFRNVANDSVDESDDPWANPKKIPIHDTARQRLLALESKILRWLIERAQNREAFVADPIGCLPNIDPSCDVEFLEYLRRVRDKTTGQKPWPQGIDISSIKISSAIAPP